MSFTSKRVNFTVSAAKAPRPKRACTPVAANVVVRSLRVMATIKSPRRNAQGARPWTSRSGDGDLCAEGLRTTRPTQVFWFGGEGAGEAARARRSVGRGNARGDGPHSTAYDTPALAGGLG